MRIEFAGLAMVATIALSACSQNPGQFAEEAVYDAAEESVTEAPEAGLGSPDSEGSIETVRTELGGDEVSGIEPEDGTPSVSSIGKPQIAYSFELGFRVPASAIKSLQERHADLCEARGPDTCRIISMRQADNDGAYSYGTLQLAVAADSAREFAKELEQSSGAVDGETTASSITGEDLSKQIVDTEARLRARSLLRDRLMEILRTRRGTVAELVEAERSVAQVNQEIDQARSWLAEMRARVAFSQMAISYEAGSRATGSFTAPIRDAWGSLGGILGTMIGFFLMAFAVVLPIALVVWACLWLWRRIRYPAGQGYYDEELSEFRPDPASELPPGTSTELR